MAPSSRPTYTKDQLKQYFDRIALGDLDIATASAEATSSDTSVQLKLLTTLLHHTLSHVPFENLDLHYAQVRGVSINTVHLFDKVVTRNAGRGGYCMQNNALFATVLRSLGYNVYSAGGKVTTSFAEPDPNSDAQVTDGVREVEFGGFGHQINIVTLSDGSRYIVDVGFGSFGPAWPVPLQHGFTRINTGTEGNVASTLKLIRGFPSNVSPGARRPETALWIYAVKYAAADDDSKQWIPCYCFAENEFYAPDYEVMNAYVSTNNTSLFLNNVICQKFIIENPGTEQAIIVGDVTLNNDSINARRYGKSESLAEIKTESDRVAALEKHLKVHLNQAEREGIRKSIRAIA